MEQRVHDEVKNKIWKAIRKVQGDGFKVGAYGIYDARRDSGEALCVLGAVMVAAGRSLATEWARRHTNAYAITSEMLGITSAEAQSLESGYEGLNFQDSQDSVPFYQLGQKILQQLQEEARSATTPSGG